MTTLTVAAAQPATAPKDVAANADAHAEAVRAAQARLVIFPELSLTGYELDADPVDPADARLDPIVQACRAAGSVALVGAPVLEAGRRHIASLAIDGDGVQVRYRKTHLGGDELDRFVAGDGPEALEVDGWRIGLGVCKDTGTQEHIDATAALGIDLYAAGLVHRPDEIEEQDRRGRHIAATCTSFVAFASFAGRTGGGYARTAGRSTLWAPDGTELARAGDQPGEIARAVLAL